MENNTLVWDNLVDAFLEDMKQFPIGDSLYAFVIAYNIATQEQKEQEKDNKKMREVWEEIDSLRSRIRSLESRPQVQPPSKMYPNWNNPDWTPHNPIPGWTVTCGTGTITTNNDQQTQYVPQDGKIHTSGYCQPEPKQKGLYD